MIPKLWTKDIECITLALLLAVAAIFVWRYRPIQLPLKFKEVEIDVYCAEPESKGKIRCIEITAPYDGELIIYKDLLDYRLRPFNCEAELVAGRYEIPIKKGQPVYLAPHNYIDKCGPYIEKQIACANDTYRGMRAKIWEEIAGGAIVGFKK